MAKAYSWNDTIRAIVGTGSSSSDRFSFKDFCDNSVANPFPTYVMPKLFGGIVSIQGDTTTFTGAAGDKIKVTINGVVYDNIDVSAATNIAGVVSRISSATLSYYNLTGYVVASVSGGNLLLTARCNDTQGDITIADGSSTVNPCVQKLFNTAARTASTSSGAYELTENNASNWFGLNGFGTPSDDTALNMGSYSIKSTVSSLPSGLSVSRIDSLNNTPRVNVYITNTSSFAVGDEVLIVGSTNFPGMIFRIETISANSYIRGYCPRYFPKVNETSIVGCSVIKPLQLAWNNTYATSYTAINGISLADNIKFAIKTDCAGTPKLKAVIIRNYLGGGSPAGFDQGAYIPVDISLPVSGADYGEYTLDIRDGYNWNWNDNVSGRGYWAYFAKLYFVFDGVAVGESVWLDGVRFTGDINPYQESENNYVFHSGLYLASGQYFRDRGFFTRFDLLDSQPTSSTPRGVIDFTAAALGDIELGDYSGFYPDREGGVIKFNTFAAEDTGYGCAFYRVQCQGITFMNNKDAYGGFSFTNCSLNKYRNCRWMNMLNFFSSETSSVFDDCFYEGGRYNFAFPPAGLTINGLTCYGVSSRNFYGRAYAPASVPTLYNIKIIDPTASKDVGFFDTYNSSAVNYQSIKFMNLDVSECASTVRFTIQNVALHNPYTVESTIGMTFDITVQDENGDGIDGADIVVKDRNGNTVLTSQTESGPIPTGEINLLIARTTASTQKSFYFNTPTVDWVYYAPFTMTISKSGYETYTEIILPYGYDRSNEACKSGYKNVVQLKTAVKIRKSDESILLAIRPDLGSSSNLIKL